MEQGKQQVNPAIFQRKLFDNVQRLTYDNILKDAYIEQLEAKIAELEKVEEKEETL